MIKTIWRGITAVQSSIDGGQAGNRRLYGNFSDLIAAIPYL